MKLAAVVSSPGTRLVFLSMAEAWLRLADYVGLGKPHQIDPDIVGAGPSPGQGTARECNPDRDQDA